jgi:glutamate racemase
MVIAFFDSGIGGLTVLKHALRELPDYDYLYFADTKNAPYGVKTAEHVKRLVFAAVDFIAKQNVQALVVACNTATSVAITDLRRRYPFRILGMEPAVKPAVITNRGGKILVLATSLTLQAGKLETLIASVDKNNKTVKMEMDALVGFAESWDFDSDRVQKYIRDKLRPLRGAGFETIVLGCTHFIFYQNLIREAVGDEIAILDGNAGTVANLKNVLAGLDGPSAVNGGRFVFYSSGVRADPHREQRMRNYLACPQCR